MSGHYSQIFRPESYHGVGEKGPFFEGWYFKLVNADRSQRLAVIPAMFMGRGPEDTHAFIQVFDGSAHRNTYLRYPADQFEGSRDTLDVKLAGNHFSSEGLQLDVQGEDLTVRGSLEFDNTHPWPSPGIMGWFAWVPIMECYHGVVSLDHGLRGSLEINGREVCFDGGRGYTEKDWGRGFPACWVWVQSNHFQTVGSSLTASIADIPLLGRRFPGFIVGVWHEGQLHRFATYTGARLETLRVQGEDVHWVMRSRTHRLELKARQGRTTSLAGPTPEDMGKEVLESLDATVEVKLEELKTGRTLMHERGECGGMEIHGDLSAIETTSG